MSIQSTSNNELSCFSALSKKEGSSKKGSLTIVGSGIMGLAQLTLEAVGAIKNADCVFYAASDPLTASFIRDNNKNAYDMYQLYAKDKMRSKTYIQMAEVMINQVRQGKRVAGVFYGHPGVFVNPSHRAIELAREEGFRAKMLPGISAEDCLFADLGIDPARVSCTSVEATDLLLRHRIISADAHVIIWQVGCVGEVGFNFTGFENRGYKLLVELLKRIYDEDHPIIAYVAATHATADASIYQILVKDLLEPENMKKISGSTTFYVPPKILKLTDVKVGKSLGLPIRPYPSLPFEEKQLALNTRMAKAAIEALPQHKVPKGYKRPQPSEGLKKMAGKIAEDPFTRVDLVSTVNENKDISLTPEEKVAVLSRNGNLLRSMMHGDKYELKTVKKDDEVTPILTNADGVEVALNPPLQGTGPGTGIPKYGDAVVVVVVTVIASVVAEMDGKNAATPVNGEGQKLVTTESKYENGKYVVHLPEEAQKSMKQEGGKVELRLPAANLPADVSEAAKKGAKLAAVPKFENGVIVIVIVLSAEVNAAVPAPKQLEKTKEPTLDAVYDNGEIVVNMTSEATQAAVKKGAKENTKAVPDYEGAVVVVVVIIGAADDGELTAKVSKKAAAEMQDQKRQVVPAEGVKKSKTDIIEYPDYPLPDFTLGAQKGMKRFYKYQKDKGYYELAPLSA
mmetsp:Transcript_17767/g.43457  ORF Transcript_17767/g.43457 Transcript_17767/m.43457 type:complete len:680 (+) Transcript_17767:3-2042(+)